MSKLPTLATLIAMGSTLAVADTFSGKLLDASCYDQQYEQKKDMQKSVQACPATSQTTSFALHASGKIYKFDSDGDSKASSALKNRADRVVPGKAQATEVMAKVDGTENSGTINVDSIDVQ